MLTVQMPMLLALLGTALMAVVIFAPSRIPAQATTAFPPGPAQPTVERWEPLETDGWEPPRTDAWEPPLPESPATARTPVWPASIDARAAACDASARLELVQALATLRSPWADAVLRRALDDEPDPSVHAAVVEALRA
ncbi:MAG TPA: hypothetical protein VGC72_11465 [Candidatus Elarobacter sp.]|jgi:hypothetical protein